MKEKISGIYKITSKLYPDRIYIGSAVDIKDRWRGHKKHLIHNKHGNKKLQRHYAKYGFEDLIFEVLITCAPEELIPKEQFFIDSMNPYFNICKIAGNSLGRRMSEETKEKLRTYNKGRHASEETRARMRKSHEGRHISEDHKRRISIANRNPSDETRRRRSLGKMGNKNTLGHHHSEEAKRKMSISQKRAAAERRRRKAEAQEQLNAENCK